MKLLVIGWDAATQTDLAKFDLPFWDSLAHSGRLLPEDLFHGTYISSGNAWTTISTGARYDQHRIFGFVHGPYVGHPLENYIEFFINRTWIPRIARRVVLGFVLGNLVTEGGRGATPQSTDVPYKRVWEYLDGDALVFGLPVTYPPWSTNGMMVAGVPAPNPEDASRPLTSPASIEDEVFDDAFSGYHVEMESPIHDASNSVERFRDAHERKTREVADRFLRLYHRYDGDADFEFGFLMLRSIDDVLHATRSDEHKRRIYETTDSVTQRIVDEIEPDAVLILSDHGMCPTSQLRMKKNTQMDHDTTQGMWGATEPFGLKRQIEVTPTILDYFDVDSTPPAEKESYDVVSERVDQEAVQGRLEDLGYM